ncbi:zinc-binding dehydrogenase [Rhodococcoides fascians]|uniref:zinc-binding dehydrogenase n=1 Tax=Rhodococcoides fascians TaxID=1828 RepID=UPI000559C050|nr:zinc-binding dehydrogenase [Rhodococcus fascians]
MLAVRWHAPKDVRVEDVPIPTVPTPGTAIVEVAYCGLCGTDLHEYLHGPNMIRPNAHPLTGQAPPITLGHEFSGTVVAMDGEAPGIEVGTRVVADPCIRCGVCRWCVNGEYHICARGGSLGLAADGALARFVVVPLSQLYRVPDNVSLELAALAEPLSVGLHAARRGDIRPGEHVLIIGAGPIGISALLGAIAAGAASVYVSEPTATRAGHAKAFGATEVFDPTETDVRREVFTRTGRIGPDVVIDATGRPELIEQAIRTTRRGGRVVIAGISDTTIPVDLRQVVLYERTIIGSLGYNHDLPRVLDLIAAGRIDPTGLITAVRPLRDTPAVLDELAADRGTHLKVLLTN